MLAFAAMCISNRRGVALAGLLLVSATELAAAELDVRIEPGNRTLRENIENHIGDLGDRDVRELLRYSRIAREQAQKALPAPVCYRPGIDSEVIAAEPRRRSMRVKPEPPERRRTVRVRVEGAAAELKSFQNPQGALEPGTTLNHGRYEEIKQRIANQASRFGFFEGRFTRQRLAVDPRENFADIELVFEIGRAHV